MRIINGQSEVNYLLGAIEVLRRDLAVAERRSEPAAMMDLSDRIFWLHVCLEAACRDAQASTPTRDQLIDRYELLETVVDKLGHDRPEVSRALNKEIGELYRAIGIMTDADIARVCTDSYLEATQAQAIAYIATLA